MENVLNNSIKNLDLIEPINDGLDPTLFAKVVDACSGVMFATHSKIRMTKFAPGKAYAEIDAEDLHSNNLGRMHGGMIAVLADHCMGAACYTTGVLAVTTNMNISFFGSGEIGKKITTVGEIIQSSKNVMFTEAYLKNEQGKIIARASGTFLYKSSF